MTTMTSEQLVEHLYGDPEHSRFDYGAFGDGAEVFEWMDEVELHEYQHGAIAFPKHHHYEEEERH